MKAVCGLDVHKDSVYLCILSEFGELVEKVFGVLTYQLEESDIRERGRTIFYPSILEYVLVQDAPTSYDRHPA
jgi:hypothetical protein